MFNPQPKSQKKVKIKKPLKKKRKVTGELSLFYEIWNERPNVCEDCGKIIFEFSPYHFHHIKTKAAYPELRLDKNNISILCIECHNNHHK